MGLRERRVAKKYEKELETLLGVDASKVKEYASAGADVAKSLASIVTEAVKTADSGAIEGQKLKLKQQELDLQKMMLEKSGGGSGDKSRGDESKMFKYGLLGLLGVTVLGGGAYLFLRK